MRPIYDEKKILELFIGHVGYLRRALIILQGVEGLTQHRRELQDLAPRYFGAVRDALTNELYTGVARLTDKSETFRDPDRPNIVVNRIIADLAATGTPLRARVDGWLAQLTPIADRVRQVRHKMLAHADLSTAISAKSLPILMWTEMHEAVDLLWNIADAIARHHAVNSDFEGDEVARDVDRLFRSVEAVPAHQRTTRIGRAETSASNTDSDLSRFP